MENRPFFVPIEMLTPSQLYISAAKLEAVRTWFRADRLAESIARMKPIPLKRMAGRLLMLDGHTRAAAAFLAGAYSLPCEWEKEEWDWAAYAADIDLCASEGITSVAALARRIIPEEDYRILWDERCDRLRDEYPYKVLTEGDEVIFYTRNSVPCPPCDVRLVDLGYDDGEYFGLFADGIMAAFGSIERYSYEFWECASIRTDPAYRRQGFGFALTAWITNTIVGAGKTATCRTLPENAGMNRIIRACGYQKLYGKNAFAQSASEER